MSDSKRNKVLAEFLQKQNLNPTSILDVAAGDGRLGACLSQQYPFAEVTAIDLKPRGNKGKIKWLKGKFPDRIDPSEFDLIVGMHPDEATWSIVEVCCRHRINFAVVPCCLLHTPKFFQKGNMHTWSDFLFHYTQKHTKKASHNLLRMKGANHVVCGIFNH